MADYVKTYLANCGGVNNAVDDTLIADNELADCRNIEPDIRGGGNLIKRHGTTQQSAAANYPAGVTSWLSKSYIYCGKNGNYFCEDYSQTGNHTFNIYAVADASILYTDSTNGNIGSWTTFESYDIFSDAFHQLKTSNGTTFTTLANIPASAYIVQPYNNYLFCLINGSTNLRWSAEGDPETWDTSHEIPFKLYLKNDAMISLRWVGDYLMLWTRKRYHLIQGFGPLDFTVVYSKPGIGASSHDLTCSTPIGAFWWSDPHGLVWSRDGFNLDYPMMRKIPQTFYTVEKYTPAYGCIIWRADVQCVSVYAFTNNQTLDNSGLRIDYYPLNDAFYLQDSPHGFGANNASYDDGVSISTYTGGTLYYLYKNKTATTGQLSCGYVNESLATDWTGFDAIDSYIKTKRFDQGSPLTTKKCNTVSLRTNLTTPSENINYAYYLDNATSATRSVTLPIDTVLKDSVTAVNSSYNRIQHYISDSIDQRIKYISLTESGEVEHTK